MVKSAEARFLANAIRALAWDSSLSASFKVGRSVFGFGKGGAQSTLQCQRQPPQSQFQSGKLPQNGNPSLKIASVQEDGKQKKTHPFLSRTGTISTVCSVNSPSPTPLTQLSSPIHKRKYFFFKKPPRCLRLSPIWEVKAVIIKRERRPTTKKYPVIRVVCVMTSYLRGNVILQPLFYVHTLTGAARAGTKHHKTVFTLPKPVCHASALLTSTPLINSIWFTYKEYEKLHPLKMIAS